MTKESEARKWLEIACRPKTLSDKIMDIVNCDEPNGDKQSMAEALERHYKKITTN